MQTEEDRVIGAGKLPLEKTAVVSGNYCGHRPRRTAGHGCDHVANGSCLSENQQWMGLLVLRHARKGRAVKLYERETRLIFQLNSIGN